MLIRVGKSVDQVLLALMKGQLATDRVRLICIDSGDRFDIDPSLGQIDQALLPSINIVLNCLVMLVQLEVQSAQILSIDHGVLEEA